MVFVVVTSVVHLIGVVLRGVIVLMVHKPEHALTRIVVEQTQISQSRHNNVP